MARELGEDRAAARDEGVDDHAAVVSVMSVGATAQLSCCDALLRFVAGVFAVFLPVARRLSAPAANFRRVARVS